MESGECSICGISGRMRSIVEVISPKGVILVCENCASEERFPILKKPNKNIFEKSERASTVSETMARLSGVKVKPREPERPELKKQENSLRKIIDKNYEEKMRMQDLKLKSRPDLIDKFHWIIMRVRRVRGLTQKQLAEAVNETEAAIKMAEQGVVPQGYEFIGKLERFLKVKLVKERNFYVAELRETRPSVAELRETRRSDAMLKEKKHENISESKKVINFDKQSLNSLTIADLQRMKKEREAEMMMEMEREDKEKTKEREAKLGKEYNYSEIDKHDRLDYE